MELRFRRFSHQPLSPSSLNEVLRELHRPREHALMHSANRCELCRREVANLTRHHLIPRARHRSKKKREGTDRAELNRVIEICGPCHRNIHAVLTEKELASEYNTIEKLAAYPGVKKFTDWVSKQSDAPIRVRSSKAKIERIRRD